jgi:hypothetical protein
VEYCHSVFLDHDVLRRAPVRREVPEADVHEEGFGRLRRDADSLVTAPVHRFVACPALPESSAASSTFTTVTAGFEYTSGSSRNHIEREELAMPPKGRTGMQRWSAIAAFALGVVLLGFLAFVSFEVRCPTGQQIWIDRVFGSLGAALVGWTIPGFISVHWRIPYLGLLQAGGAVALLLVLYLSDPPAMQNPESNPQCRPVAKDAVAVNLPPGLTVREALAAIMKGDPCTLVIDGSCTSELLDLAVGEGEMRAATRFALVQLLPLRVTKNPGTFKMRIENDPSSGICRTHCDR